MNHTLIIDEYDRVIYVVLSFTFTSLNPLPKTKKCLWNQFFTIQMQYNNSQVGP
jgi:hypothetical protein